MTFNELMNIRKYLASASKRLTVITENCGIETFDQRKRFDDSWNIVREYMEKHPELPYVC